MFSVRSCLTAKSRHSRDTGQIQQAAFAMAICLNLGILPDAVSTEPILAVTPERVTVSKRAGSIRAHSADSMNAVSLEEYSQGASGSRSIMG